MTREEREKLLARYTTGELSPVERERLFSEALHDQALFDELFEEDALTEALADPDLRRHVMNAAPSPAPSWPLRWRWTVLAGLAASLVLAVFFIQRQITPTSDPELLASARPPVARDIEPLRSPAPDSLDFSAAPAATLKALPPPPARATFSAPAALPEKAELADTTAVLAQAAAPARKAAGRAESATAAAESATETTVALASEARVLPPSPAPVADMAAKSLAAPPPFRAVAEFSSPAGRWQPIPFNQSAPAGAPLRLLITAALPVTVSLAGDTALVLPGQPRPFALPALASGEHDIRLQWTSAIAPPTAGPAAPRARLLSVTPNDGAAPGVFIFRLRVE